ncbi:MAG TPA: VWA domain-containing protein [Pyrinomonadaceae bacterium]
MKAIIFLLIATVAVISCQAQSRRVAPTGTGKSNQRAPQPLPTPTPLPRNNTIAETATDDGEVVKVDTSLVTVPVRVIDRKGRFVGGLTKDNFKVFEDGAERDIAYFSSEQEPFTVALVLDMSYSTKFQIADIQSAAISFIDQLGPRDKVMVVSFDEEVHMLCEPTNDRAQIYRAIRSTRIATGTSLYEAVDLVMNERLKRIKGRKAIILFTDGVDTTSTRSNDLQNLDDAREIDALIYPIRYDTYEDVQAMKNRPVIGNPPVSNSPFPRPNPTGTNVPISVPTTVSMPSERGTSAEDYRRAQEYLEQLSLRTGGRTYLADSFGNLSGAFSKIASELREYYSLGFYPPDNEDAGKVRKIKVRVDKPEVAVKSRDSYVLGDRAKKKGK